MEVLGYITLFGLLGAELVLAWLVWDSR